MSSRVATKRISRDIQNLFSHDFSSSAASLMAADGQSAVTDGNLLYVIRLYICIHEGPYRGGHFIFYLNIPENYPFRGVNVLVDQSRPLWHPNVELHTGRVLLPLEWSPVLTLTSLAVAIQMMLLEPSAENPLNLEACSYYSNSPHQFDVCVQRTLRGYTIGDSHFLCMQNLDCACCGPAAASNSTNASSGRSGSITDGVSVSVGVGVGVGVVRL